MSAVALSATPPSVPPRTRRILEAPILPTLLKLALPNILVVMVSALSSTVDAVFVARLGPEALAGVSLVHPVWMLMATMSNGGFGGGVVSAVARALGGGRHADANALVGHALWMTLLMGALFTAVPLLAGPAIYRAMGGADDVLSLALTYSNVVFGGALLVWLVATLGSVLRGTGEMVYTAGVIVAGELLHLVLAPLLIFGLGPFPALGVAGAGLSLLISYAVRAMALASFLLAGRAATTVTFGVPRFRARLFWEILKVALPGSANTILTNANVMVVTSLVGAFGTLALAGYGAGARLEYLQIPLIFGMGTALVAMVGTNVGAGRRDRAERIAWTGATMAGVVTGTIGVTAALVPGAWAGLFTSDPAVAAVTSAYLRIVGPAYALFGVGLALYFASQGAGRLRWPVVASVTRLLLATGGGWAALALLGGGLTSLFVAMAAALAAYGGLTAWAVRAGAWR